MRDADATRRRILDAGTEEFARHGIAGSRVDRIAAASRSNKAQLYHYFGGKEALFDAVFADHVAANVGTVPLTADDLPGYAVRLHDAYLADPALERLLSWVRLERRPAGALFADVPGHDLPAIAKLTRAQEQGVLVDDVEATDLWSMLLALCGTWAQASITTAGHERDPRAVLDRRREALRRTVARAFCR